MCLVLSTCSTVQDSDVYIGLYRDASECTCVDVSTSTCTICRSSWSWYEGTPMSWWNWQNEEPNQFACGRLSSDGWVDSDCTGEFKYVCEKGLFIVLCHLFKLNCDLLSLRKMFSCVMMRVSLALTVWYFICFRLRGVHFKPLHSWQLRWWP